MEVGGKKSDFMMDIKSPTNFLNIIRLYLQTTIKANMLLCTLWLVCNTNKKEITMQKNDNFSKETILEVWQKAKIIDGADPKEYRQDRAGAWIQFSMYGNTNDDLNFGWEVDHQKPKALGGSNNLSNLVPRQWLNNRTKGDDYPHFKTSVSSQGNKNVYKKESWKIDT